LQATRAVPVRPVSGPGVVDEGESSDHA
jgi:hypothetical protein